MDAGWFIFTWILLSIALVIRAFKSFRQLYFTILLILVFFIGNLLSIFPLDLAASHLFLLIILILFSFGISCLLRIFSPSISKLFFLRFLLSCSLFFSFIHCLFNILPASWFLKFVFYVAAMMSVSTGVLSIYFTCASLPFFSMGAMPPPPLGDSRVRRRLKYKRSNTSEIDVNEDDPLICTCFRIIRVIFRGIILNLVLAVAFFSIIILTIDFPGSEEKKVVFLIGSIITSILSLIFSYFYFSKLSMPTLSAVIQIIIALAAIILGFVVDINCIVLFASCSFGITCSMPAHLKISKAAILRYLCDAKDPLPKRRHVLPLEYEKITQDEVINLILVAKRILIIPGAGILDFDLLDRFVSFFHELRKRERCVVNICIHALAGNSPYQLHAELLRWGVDHSSFLSVADANTIINEVDLAFVVGASDTVDPLFSFPVCDVSEAHHVVIFKRSLNCGFAFRPYKCSSYAPHENALFYKYNSKMMLYDAIFSLDKLIGKLQLFRKSVDNLESSPQDVAETSISQESPIEKNALRVSFQIEDATEGSTLLNDAERINSSTFFFFPPTHTKFFSLIRIALYILGTIIMLIIGYVFNGLIAFSFLCALSWHIFMKFALPWQRASFFHLSFTAIASIFVYPVLVIAPMVIDTSTTLPIMSVSFSLFVGFSGIILALYAS